MKSFLLFLSLCFAGTAVQAQAGVEGALFSHSAHDFGTIPQGKPVYYSFSLNNSGTDTLRVDAVNASCGCTTPEWSREPIAPGKTGTIRVGFNAASEGPFAKTITVQYNGAQSTVLTIQGQVWRAPATPAPLNTAQQFLKNLPFN